MIYSMKNKDELKDLEEFDDLQTKVKRVRLVEKLCKQGFQYDVKVFCVPITKTLTDTRNYLFEEAKSNTKSLMELDEINKNVIFLKSMNKNEVIHSSLIRPIAKFLKPKNKNQFRQLDFHNSDNWYDYKMKREKSILDDKKLLFKDTGKVFTLKGDILSMKNDYDFDETNSAVAKQIIDFMDKMLLYIRAKGKISKDKIVITK